MRRFGWWVAVAAAVLVGGCAPAPDRALQLLLVDHASFRKLDGKDGRLEEDGAALARNLGEARRLGADGYVIFTGDVEKALTYDFEVEGIGTVGERAFPVGSEGRAAAMAYREALREGIAAGRSAGIPMWVHTNQFSYPQPVFDLARPAIADARGEICPDRPATWALYRATLGELFTVLPGLSGLQLTADEAEQGVFGCADGGGPTGEGGAVGAPDGSTEARVRRLVEETAAVADAFGLRVDARTWGRLYRLEEEGDPARMMEGLPPNVRLSLKYSQGDFHLFSPPSPLLEHVGPGTVLEFDAWGEHLGWNHFPCWQGEIWAPVVAAAAARGADALAVRISWDTQAMPIFQRPWGNVINIDYAKALSLDPQLSPDAFLRAWVAKVYPPKAREAAAELYRRSPRVQAIWQAEGEVELTDHSRMLRPYGGGDPFERVRDRLDRLQEAGGFRLARDFDDRRSAIRTACEEADALVAALPAEALGDWRSELSRGARAQCRVALGVTDQLELLHWRRELDAGRSAPGLAPLAQSIRRSAEAWESEDDQSFELLEGRAALTLLETLPVD